MEDKETVINPFANEDGLMEEFGFTHISIGELMRA
jgi:hypothetical protein